MISFSDEHFLTRLMRLYARINRESDEYEPSTINKCNMEQSVENTICRGLKINRINVLINKARNIR